ncbi:HipA family kinase [Olivibacter sitiensis]|uniref:HipA family kinase n=1 Tax=Olivibacter sitiensis TaxID=376470 RepID=UPI00041D1F9B|nr:HipA family kinase [Olivibacter sitiensis]
MSIKLPDFKLPYVFAVEGGEELKNSANQPLIVAGIDKETVERGDYVVKLNASERMHKESRMRVLIAVFMAIELGISVVMPAVIEVTDNFVETLRGKAYYVKASKSLGYNVGSEYEKSHFILDNQITLSNELEKLGQHIFAFDVFIENVDRNHAKPNMITNGKNLVLLDHELAFGYATTPAFLRNPTPWVFSDGDRGWMTKHCLYQRLKGKIGEVDAFKERMVTLDGSFWDKARTLIPQEWFVGELFDGIVARSTSLIAHKDEWINEIKQLLA